MSKITPLGFPYPEIDVDAPNGPEQMQSLAEAIDTWLTARAQVRRQVRTDGTLITAPADGSDKPVPGFSSNAINVGSIGYGAGIFTVTQAGLYQLDVYTKWPASGGSHSVYSRQVGFYQNGARPVAWNEVRRDETAVALAGSRAYYLTGAMMLAAGDTVQPYLAQSSGVDEAVLVAACTVRRVG